MNHIYQIHTQVVLALILQRIALVDGDFQKYLQNHVFLDADILIQGDHLPQEEECQQNGGDEDLEQLRILLLEIALQV